MKVFDLMKWKKLKQEANKMPNKQNTLNMKQLQQTWMTWCSYECSHELNMAEFPKPTSLREAMNQKVQRDVMKKEYDALIKNQKWNLVDPSRGTKSKSLLNQVQFRQLT